VINAVRCAVKAITAREIKVVGKGRQSVVTDVFLVNWENTLNILGAPA